MDRGIITAAIAGVLITLAGCGQTDYASDVTDDSAQLNATITTLTDGVETTAWFEYWPAASPSNVQQTPDHSVAATGPLSDDIGGLANHTEYRYRLCATEDDSEAVCAQTHRFTTGRDTVQAYGESERRVYGTLDKPHWLEDLDFDVVAGPAGVSGLAFVSYRVAAGSSVLTFPIGSRTAPDVTCFDVDGNVAVIGLALHYPENVPYQQAFIELVDGGPLGSGQDAIAIRINGFPVEQTPDRDASDCSPTGKPRFKLITGEIVVNEAPPAPG